MDVRTPARKLLILDLDETLIYAAEVPLARPADFELAHYSVYLRPGLAAFVELVFRHFDVAVWTSSSRLYADSLCPRIFGERVGDLRFVWARERCTPARDWGNDSWTHAKRLHKVRRLGIDLAQVIMVDDSPEKHTKNYGNLVCVRPWLGMGEDDELERLGRYLVRLVPVVNVRAVEKRYWRAQAEVDGRA